MGRPLDWFDQLSIVLSDIWYKDWGFKFTRVEVPDYREYAILQAIWTDDSGALSVVQKSRKWYISSFMTKSEFIQTVFLCVQTAEEHEAREKFKYKGVAILGPHLDLEQKVGFDVRAFDEQAYNKMRNEQMKNIANDPKFFSPP